MARPVAQLQALQDSAAMRTFEARRRRIQFGERRSADYMTQIVFSFASAANANRLVAGVPAAARLAREWCIATRETNRDAPLRLQLRDEGRLEEATMAQIKRLAGRIDVFAERAPKATSAVFNAEELPDFSVIQSWISALDKCPAPISLLDSPDAQQALYRAERRIIKATAKAGDGIVSQWLNRPISQAISKQLLKLDWMRPGHATLLCAMVAIAMFVSLVMGGHEGLIVGAILFQCASILDGVDGEIARATWRSSDQGAMLDSATDAATNLGFIAGVIFNRWQVGAIDEAIIGLVGLGILLAGLTVLGVRSLLLGEALNFDGAKKIIGEHPSRIKSFLRYVTMRDFYCLFLVVLVLCGLVSLAFTIFAAAAALWLIAIIAMIAGRSQAFRAQL
jgi:1L-myo-inositol 1-phosphate cytidylyltransferase / CDP-L-myo-inositol myo-inositolphosphotransferase